MATINEILERTAAARPDAYSDEEKARWLLGLEGRLFREVVQRHLREPEPFPEVCPVCEEEGTTYVVRPGPGWYACERCGWTDEPVYPKVWPEDGDLPLLARDPFDRLYELYLYAQIDFYNREYDNYNNSTAAYNAALDEWRQKYHREHMPLPGPGVRGL